MAPKWQVVIVSAFKTIYENGENKTVCNFHTSGEISWTVLSVPPPSGRAPLMEMLWKKVQWKPGALKPFTSLSLSPPTAECAKQELWSPAEEKRASSTSFLSLSLSPSLSGNYVFYLGDTSSYFNVGHPAVLMAHYSNKWLKQCGVGDPLRATGPSIPAHLLRQGNVYCWHLDRTETKWRPGSVVRSGAGPS